MVRHSFPSMDAFGVGLRHRRGEDRLFPVWEHERKQNFPREIGAVPAAPA
jgi:hypothetical protein